MRVLHINSGNLYGGIETLLVTFARMRSLCPAMDPEFALCFEGRASEELRQTGARVHTLGAARVSRPWTIWRARRALARVLADRSYDVVVCHGSWNHALFSPVVRRLQLPLVFWAHGPSASLHWLDRWASWTLPDLVLTNSRWTRANMGFFASVQAEVLPCPVADTSRHDQPKDRREIRAELGTAESAVVVMQACRLEPWKGHELLLDALSRLASVGGWECWIAGGPQRAEENRYLEGLRKRAEAGGVGARVRFLGQRQDVPRLLAAADIHCQPNTGPEPFGIAFVEALYAGLPVVTTAHGGALEVLTEDCALLVPPGDGAALSNSLHRLITEPELRRSLGQAGPARARALCDPQHTLDRLADHLRQVIAATRPATSPRDTQVQEALP
jgi:glycosyltransferase involved in cell wall biosynthesis